MNDKNDAISHCEAISTSFVIPLDTKFSPQDPVLKHP